MRGRLNRVLFYSFSYVMHHNTRISDTAAALLSHSIPHQTRASAVWRLSLLRQDIYSSLVWAMLAEIKIQGKKARRLQIWISCLSLAHKHASHFFLQSRLWPERRLIHTNIQTKVPQEMQKKRQQIAVSVFFHQQLTLFFKAWQHFTGSEVTVR